MAIPKTPKPTTKWNPIDSIRPENALIMTTHVVATCCREPQKAWNSDAVAADLVNRVFRSGQMTGAALKDAGTRTSFAASLATCRPLGKPLRSRYERVRPWDWPWRAVVAWAAITSSKAIPTTTASASVTLSRFGLRSLSAGSSAATYNPSPAARLHSPAVLSGDRQSTPLAISRAP